jgi:uroporphyrinogen-III decarboxylase
MKDWLKGARRLASAISGTPDCVPIYGPLPNHAMCLTGIPSKTFYTTADLFVESQLMLAEYYGFDFPYVYGDVPNIEAEALGMRIVFRPQASPLIDPDSVIVHSSKDIDLIRTPDFYSAGRMPFVLEAYRLLGERIGIPALRWFCAPFSLACAIRGYSAWVRDMRRNPSFAQALLERLTEQVLVPWIELSLNQVPAARAAAGFDAWATFPVINEEIFYQYVIPPALKLRQYFSDKGSDVVVTSGWGDSLLSDPRPILNQKIRLRGALRGLDPDVQILGPKLYADVASDHSVPLGLGIDAQLIHDGPIEAIVERIKSYIRIAAPHGRLTLIINNVAGDTPPAHIHAAVAAAHIYGRYPIANDLDSIPFEMPDFEPFSLFARRQGLKVETLS